MKKIKLEIEETLIYQRSMLIEVPDDFSEEALEDILDEAEKTASSGQDVSYVLEKFKGEGVKVLDHADDDLSSPYKAEIEIEINDKSERDGEKDAE